LEDDFDNFFSRTTHIEGGVDVPLEVVEPQCLAP